MQTRSYTQSCCSYHTEMMAISFFPVSKVQTEIQWHTETSFCWYWFSLTRSQIKCVYLCVCACVPADRHAYCCNLLWRTRLWSTKCSCNNPPGYCWFSPQNQISALSPFCLSCSFIYFLLYFSFSPLPVITVIKADIWLWLFSFSSVYMTEENQNHSWSLWFHDFTERN